MTVSRNFPSCPWLIVKFSCVVQDRLEKHSSRITQGTLPKFMLYSSSVTDLENFPELSMTDFLTDDKFSEYSFFTEFFHGRLGNILFSCLWYST